MPNDDSLLTAPQVGHLLGKSGRTVVRLAEKGDFPVAQRLPGPNGAYLFRRSDVVAFLDAAADEAYARRQAVPAA